MKNTVKKLFVLLILIMSFHAFAKETPESPSFEDEYEEKEESNTAWTNNIFVDLGFLYNYEYLKGDPLPEFLSHNLGVEFGLGYDFGRATARIYGNYDFLLDGNSKWSNGSWKISETLKSEKWKLGLEAGVKLYNGDVVNIIIPIGFLFNWTKYEEKNPSYTDYNYLYDRYWNFEYTNVYSGLQISFKCSNHFKLILLSNIGYSLSKEHEYEEVLRGNVVWIETGTSTYGIKFDMDVLEYSAGISARINF